MAQDIRNGRLDAAVHDQPIIAASIKDHPEWNLVSWSYGYEPHQLKNPAGYSRYAFRQADVQLRTGFSAAIEWMEDSGDITQDPHEMGAERLQQLTAAADWRRCRRTRRGAHPDGGAGTACSR